MKIARQTCQIPERLAAITLLCIGPFGFGLTVASALLTSHSTRVADLVWATAALALNAGAATCLIFSQRVFYAGNKAASRLVAAVAFALLALWIAEGFATGYSAADPASVQTLQRPQTPLHTLRPAP